MRLRSKSLSAAHVTPCGPADAWALKQCPVQVMERVIEVFGQPVPRASTATPQRRPVQRPILPGGASGDPALQQHVCLSSADGADRLLAADH